MRKHINPGTMLGLIAVVFAMGGTAFAATALTGKDIKNGSLTGADVKNGSLSKADLSSAAVNSLKGNDGTNGAMGPQGAAGAKGETGAQGPKGLDGAAADKGAKGDTGAQGPVGPIGPQGPKGDNGADGADGTNGADGADGADGAPGTQGVKGDDGAQGPAGPAGILAPLSDSLAAPMAIATIGGPINDGNTDLGTGMTLDPGTYLVTVDAAFESAQDATDPSVEVYPQVSLWIDRDHDGAFQWQAQEGDISPNAIMPVAKNRHISASGITQVTLTEPTYVGLLAFGYTSTQGSERSGEIDVTRAVVGALKVATP